MSSGPRRDVRGCERRASPVRIELEESDFESGGLPRRSFAAPYALTTIKHDDMGPVDGGLTPSKTEEICESAGRYLGLGD